MLWVADITYLRTGEGWLYLAAVQDTYSRQIVGWSITSSGVQHAFLATAGEVMRDLGTPESGIASEASDIRSPSSSHGSASHTSRIVSGSTLGSELSRSSSSSKSKAA